MISIILVIIAVLAAVIAAIAFVLNGNTPMQSGPLPVLGGAILCIVCVLALIARHIVWQ